MNLRKPVVIIVDDEPMITETICTYLELTTDYELKSYNDPLIALEDMRTYEFDVVVSDFLMPHINGLDFLSEIKTFAPNSIMIILTGYADKENAIRAINELDLFQYVEKPWENDKLKMIIRNGIDKKRLSTELEEKVVELKKSNKEIYETRLEIIKKLGRAAEYKDNETGMHVDRMSKYCYQIALAYGLNEQDAELLMTASPMHDIGKIGIPDYVLQKPGKLDSNEWDIMTSHPRIGSEIIGNSSADLLSVAKIVAIQHHEKWNGKGYPNGISGEDIHIFARITAVADVFDAVISKRPYKEAWPLEKAFELIESEKGEHFDPKVVEAFFIAKDKIVEIKLSCEE